MYTPDDTNITKVKKNAVYKTLHEVRPILMILGKILQGRGKDIPEMLEDQSAEKFTVSLIKCHSLTLHLLAHDWSKYHDNINTWFCPLSHSTKD